MRFIIIIMSSAILLISNSECRGQVPLVVITDLDNSGGPFVCSDNTCTWTSGEFSIAGVSEFVLSADSESLSPDEYEDSDYLTISYRIDNGPWIPVMELIDYFRRTTFTTSLSDSGLTMQLKIDSQTSVASEIYKVHKLTLEAAAGSIFPSFPPDTGIDPNCGMQASAGTLIIDGGSLERVPTHPTIIAMIEHMGGLETHIVASYQGQREITPAEYTEYTDYWVDIGFETVSTMTSDEHDMVESNTEDFVADLTQANGMFMRGGRQWRIVDTFGNADVSTLTLDEMWNLLGRGGVIGGTSAGATVQGDFMPRGDTSGSGTMISEEPLHQQGFRFLANVAFDVHVSARGRITDLKEVMEYTNARGDDIIGIGIDEDTAIVVQGKVFEVIGSGVVYVHTWNESVVGGNILILKAGDKYNLCTRQEFVAGVNLANGSQGALEIFYDMNDVSYDNFEFRSLHRSGGTEEPNDPSNFDVSYSPRSFSPNGKGAKIVSIVDSNELRKDSRGLDSNTPVNLELSLHEKDGYDMILVNHENSLKFSYGGPLWEFDGNEPITYWEKDANDPNYACLIANVRKEILQGISGIGEVPLPILNGTYESEVPHLRAGIRYDIYDVDLNEDGKIDLRDYAIFANNWKRTGITNSQRSNPSDPGAWSDFNLDNQVDFKDFACFNDLWVYDISNTEFK